MGGIGSLRLAFTYPEMFAGVAALEPALDPVFEPAEFLDRNLCGRGDYELTKGLKVPHGTMAAETKAMFGAIHHSEWDVESYYSYNPACVVRANAQNIRESGLRVYFEAADEDFLCLHDGAEFLHKTLWQYRIPHQYQLCLKADHLGPSLIWRMNDTMEWICRHMKDVLDPPDKTLTPGQELYMKWLSESEHFMGDPNVNPPEGAEPLTVLDQPFLEHIKKQMPEYLAKHMNSPTEGVDRLPESLVREKRIERKVTNNSNDFC